MTKQSIEERFIEASGETIEVTSAQSSSEFSVSEKTHNQRRMKSLSSRFFRFSSANPDAKAKLCRKTTMNPQTFTLTGHRVPEAFSKKKSFVPKVQPSSDSPTTPQQQLPVTAPAYPHMCPLTMNRMKMPMAQTYHHGSNSMSSARADQASSETNPGPKYEGTISFAVPPMLAYHHSPLQRGGKSLHK